MKILVLNGSPKEKSDTMVLTNSFLEGIRKNGNHQIKVVDLIKKNKYGNEILSKYINQNDIIDTVNIKKDFCTAFREEKDVSEIAHKLDYGLSSSDLRSLAVLHKENKCRRKIEELLTSCNFHYACAKFANKEYNEFL